MTSPKSDGLSDADEMLREANEENAWRHIRLCVAQDQNKLKQQIKKEEERIKTQNKDKKVCERREKKEREKQEKKERKEREREEKAWKKLLERRAKKNLSFCDVPVYLFTGDQAVTMPMT
ncbi:uncharacterized protein LOC144021764 [Festucalex cinctus]